MLALARFTAESASQTLSFQIGRFTQIPFWKGRGISLSQDPGRVISSRQDSGEDIHGGDGPNPCPKPIQMGERRKDRPFLPHRYFVVKGDKEQGGEKPAGY